MVLVFFSLRIGYSLFKPLQIVTVFLYNKVNKTVSNVKVSLLT